MKKANGAPFAFEGVDEAAGVDAPGYSAGLLLAGLGAGLLGALDVEVGL